jgi:hypothetical protein
LACPWLIRTFIDPNLNLFLPRDSNCPDISDGTVFDVPGCELGHHGDGGKPVSLAQQRSVVRHATNFLGLNTNTSVLLLAIVLIAAGEETWMRFVPKYLEMLGASLFIIGAYDALKTLLGAVYAWPGGIAVDRWGHAQL